MTIKISAHQLHFDFSGGCDNPCVDWGRIGTAPFPGSQVPLTSTQVLAELNRTLASRAPGAAGASSGTGAAATGTAATVNPFVFNHDALPAPVRERRQNMIQKKPVCSNMVVPCEDAAGAPLNCHHMDGSDRITLADGTLFVVLVPDIKGLCREPPPCTDTTPAGMRAWCPSLQRHALNHGFHVHGLWCFRKDHGGTDGFTAGNGPDDDLPGTLSDNIEFMRQPLAQLLSKKGMFPKEDDRCEAIVAQAQGDGHAALLNIVRPHAPQFATQRGMLCTACPRQRELSMEQHGMRFKDFLNVRSCVKNSPSSLDDSDEIDIFIGRAKHQKHLNRCTRDERRQPACAHKCTAAQIVGTLNAFLLAADSPALADDTAASRSAQSSSPPASRQLSA
ncbi:MAG: hypothetical protein R3330_17020, partial [Saprospiraceae bacterium]|nr:hypothetical protein [Saprospiraceae bacterium]